MRKSHKYHINMQSANYSESSSLCTSHQLIIFSMQWTGRWKMKWKMRDEFRHRQFKTNFHDVILKAKRGKRKTKMKYVATEKLLFLFPPIRSANNLRAFFSPRAKSTHTERIFFFCFFCWIRNIFVHWPWRRGSKQKKKKMLKIDCTTNLHSGKMLKLNRWQWRPCARKYCDLCNSIGSSRSRVIQSENKWTKRCRIRLKIISLKLSAFLGMPRWWSGVVVANKIRFILTYAIENRWNSKSNALYQQLKVGRVYTVQCTLYMGTWAKRTLILSAS